MLQTRGNLAHKQARATWVSHQPNQLAKPKWLHQPLQAISCGCLPRQKHQKLVPHLLGEGQGSLTGFPGSHDCPEVGHRLLYNLWAVYSDNRHLRTWCMLGTRVCPLGALRDGHGWHNGVFLVAAV